MKKFLSAILILSLVALLGFVFFGKQSQAHLVDVTYRGSGSHVVNLQESYQEALRTWVSGLALKDGDVVTLKSRPNKKDQTFEYSFQVSQQGEQFMISFEGSQNPQATAESTGSLHEELYRVLMSNLDLHKRTVLDPSR